MLQRLKNVASPLKEVACHPLLTLGFSLFWLWVWLVVQSSFLNSTLLSFSYSSVSGWVVPLLAYGITFIILGILYATKRIVPRGLAYIIILCVAASFGIASIAIFASFPTTSELLTTLLITVGSVLAGAGTAGMHMEWGRLLGGLGPRRTIIHGTFGTVGAMLLTLAYLSLPLGAKWALVALLPLAVGAILISQQHLIPVTEEQKEVVRLIIPWRFLTTSFIQGTAFGILQVILLIMDRTQETTLISVAGSVIGALLVFAVVFAFRLDFNQLIYHVGFVTLAASFAIMAIAGSFFMGGWLMNATGYRFIDILMWALCAHLIKHRGLPTNWVFSITTCALILGQVFGAISGEQISNAFYTEGGGLEILSILMIFIILTGALFMANKRNLEQGWGMIRPYQSEEQRDSVAVSCTLVTDDYGLTARELEIFILLARGKRRSFIAKELTLAPETIKTHVRNIYRKMDIHSQDELMELVEGRRTT